MRTIVVLCLALSKLSIGSTEHTAGLPVQDAMDRRNDGTMEPGAGLLADSDIHTAFAVLDSDGSSTLSKSELRLGMQQLSLPLTEDELDALATSGSELTLSTFSKLLK